jgi:S-ribosylhomocysteine lyase LuxS involved in autoinducer biosynthesis
MNRNRDEGVNLIIGLKRFKIIQLHGGIVIVNYPCGEHDQFYLVLLGNPRVEQVVKLKDFMLREVESPMKMAANGLWFAKETTNETSEILGSARKGNGN